MRVSAAANSNSINTTFVQSNQALAGSRWIRIIALGIFCGGLRERGEGERVCKHPHTATTTAAPRAVCMRERVSFSSSVLGVHKSGPPACIQLPPENRHSPDGQLLGSSPSDRQNRRRCATRTKSLLQSPPISNADATPQLFQVSSERWIIHEPVKLRLLNQILRIKVMVVFKKPSIKIRINIMLEFCSFIKLSHSDIVSKLILPVFIEKNNIIILIGVFFINSQDSLSNR
jgi:hypothetical protein